jgi:hypothetical protein
MGPRNSSGYGMVGMRWKRGPRKGKVGNRLVHRLALALFNKIRLTAKSVVRHRCNVKLCCNPHHLLKGSSKQNQADVIAAGNHRSPIYPPGHPNHVAPREPGEDDLKIAA